MIVIVVVVVFKNDRDDNIYAEETRLFPHFRSSRQISTSPTHDTNYNEIKKQKVKNIRFQLGNEEETDGKPRRMCVVVGNDASMVKASFRASFLQISLRKCSERIFDYLRGFRFNSRYDFEECSYVCKSD